MSPLPGRGGIFHCGRFSFRRSVVAGAAPVAIVVVVVDEAHGLHEGIDGGRADEAEAALAQILAQGARRFGLRRDGPVKDRRRCRSGLRNAICMQQKLPNSFCSSSTQVALLMVDSILPRCRMMPASSSRRSTSAGVMRATFFGSKALNCLRTARACAAPSASSDRTENPRGRAFRTAGCRRRRAAPIRRRGRRCNRDWSPAQWQRVILTSPETISRGTRLTMKLHVALAVFRDSWVSLTDHCLKRDIAPCARASQPVLSPSPSRLFR